MFHYIWILENNVGSCVWVQASESDYVYLKHIKLFETLNKPKRNKHSERVK